MPHPHVAYAPPRLPHDVAQAALHAELALLADRRSVRRFSKDPVPRSLIEHALRIAGTAPSGAHRQPWHFVVISSAEKKHAIASLHRAGLATLPHTPAPMAFLREVCGRPPSDRPYVILPVGYPTADCTVPDLRRKSLEEIATFVEQ